ncbi:MAG TPA: M20 family metallopeptidase [Bacteroidota bacterium]
MSTRRRLHAYPELSFEEVETTRHISSVLKRAGVRHAFGPVETGLIAEVGSGDVVLGLRADIDAINVQEDTGLPFSSRVQGKMHACGHDAHTAMLLGTALVLADLQDRLPGRVRLIFQPAEEANPSGGRLMVERGFLDQEPKITELYALHLQPSLPAGSIGVRAGTLLASSDGIDLRILGRSGHAATPHEAVDAIALSAQVINALQSVVSRCLNPTRPVVLSFGVIRGGTRHSVIASEVELLGTLRCTDSDTRKRALGLIHQVAESVAAGFGGSALVTVRPSQPVTLNDAGCVERVVRAATAALGVNSVVRMEEPFMGAEDFSRFAEQVPAAISWLGTRVGDSAAPLHSPKMIFPEEIMGDGIRLFAQLVADFFDLP